MKISLIFLLIVLVLGFNTFQTNPARLNTPTITPTPPIYSQAEITRVMEVIETRYGIGFAYPDEWIAASASEIIWFTDYLHTLLEALEIATENLHLWGKAPTEITPAEFFRQHFDQAHLQLDRARSLPDDFAGNTLPIFENSEVIGYMIQLAPAGMSSHFTLIHELGHVLDGLLKDVPHQDFVNVLGGEWSTDAWIPGEGYAGYEALFPRAVAGANEDFADTFGQMLLGNLPAENPRYDFMLEYLPTWLEANSPPDSS